MASTKGILYEITAVENVMGALHGSSTKIKEIYIPKFNLTFNVIHNQLNVFRENRYRDAKSNGFLGNNPKPKILSEIDIPDEVAAELELMVEKEYDLKAVAKKLLESK